MLTCGARGISSLLVITLFFSYIIQKRHEASMYCKPWFWDIAIAQKNKQNSSFGTAHPYTYVYMQTKAAELPWGLDATSRDSRLSTHNKRRNYLAYHDNYLFTHVLLTECEPSCVPTEIRYDIQSDFNFVLSFVPAINLYLTAAGQFLAINSKNTHCSH